VTKANDQKGTLTVEGGAVTLVFERLLPHRPEHVWDAIATPAGLREWLLCSEAAIDGRVGGRIELVSGPASYRSTGKILVWQPPRALEYEWKVAPVREMPEGEDAIFRYDLAARGGSTLLTLTYRRITLATARGFLPGVHAFLDRLEAQLDGAPLPDWVARFGQVRADYPEWTAHAAPSGE
jgi:uncharacterized protein YndB with AHSA1/START domain